jgi:hypothetical protein
LGSNCKFRISNALKQVELTGLDSAKPKEEYEYSYMDQFYSGEDLNDIHKPHEETYQQNYSHENYDYGHTQGYNMFNEHQNYKENALHNEYHDLDHNLELEHTDDYDAGYTSEPLDDAEENKETNAENVNETEEMVNVDIKDMPMFSGSEETQATLVVVLLSSFVNKAYQSMKEKEETEEEKQLEACEDPYKVTVDEEAILDYYHQLNMGSMPEFDRSFEFEPKFEPKNLEDYTKDPHKNLVFLKEFPTYTKELVFRFKGMKFTYFRSKSS